MIIAKMPTNRVPTRRKQAGEDRREPVQRALHSASLPPVKVGPAPGVLVSMATGSHNRVEAQMVCTHSHKANFSRVREWTGAVF